MYVLTMSVFFLIKFTQKFQILYYTVNLEFLKMEINM